MLLTLTHSDMPESPRRTQDVEEAAATSDEALSAASALQAKTQVVKFDDFQSHFFPTRSAARPAKAPPGTPEEPQR